MKEAQMEVNKVLAEAWAEVEKASLPEQLREVAFKEAIAMLTSEKTPKQSGDSRHPRSPRPKVDDVEKGSNDGKQGPADLLSKFSHEADIPVDVLEEILYFDDGLPRLSGPARKLGVRKSDQMRRVAIVLTGAYLYALDQTDVPAKVIRAECDRLKILDGGNFATVMGDTPVVVGTGSARSRNFKLKSGTAGLTALKTAINEIRGVKDDV
jgi:hypothetical protein